MVRRVGINNFTLPLLASSGIRWRKRIDAVFSWPDFEKTKPDSVRPPSYRIHRILCPFTTTTLIVFRYHTTLPYGGGISY